MAVRSRGRPLVRPPKSPLKQDNAKTALPATDLNKGISVPGTGATTNVRLGAIPTRNEPPGAGGPRPVGPGVAGVVSEENIEVFESRQPRGRTLRPSRGPRPSPGPSGAREPKTRLETLVDESDALTSRANPFRRPGRGDFDPSTQVPTTLDEVTAARAFLRETEDQVVSAVDQIDPFTNEPTGRLINSFTGELITPENLAFMEWRETLKAEIEAVRANDEAIVQEQTFATIENSRDLFRAFLDEQKQEALDSAATDEDIRRIDAEYDRRIEEVEERGIEDRITAQQKFEFDQELRQRQAEFDLALDNNRFNFQAGQNELDRLLRAGELELAVSAQASLDFFTQESLVLRQKEFQLDMFSTLAQSPEILHFLGQQPGMLQQFGDLMGDGGESLNRIFERLDERPTTNLQEFQRLSQEEQGIESFRLAAKTGTRDVRGLLQREAPTSVGINPSAIQRQRLGRRQ